MKKPYGYLFLFDYFIANRPYIRIFSSCAVLPFLRGFPLTNNAFVTLCSYNGLHAERHALVHCAELARVVGTTLCNP